MHGRFLLHKHPRIEVVLDRAKKIAETARKFAERNEVVAAHAHHDVKDIETYYKQASVKFAFPKLEAVLEKLGLV